MAKTGSRSEQALRGPHRALQELASGATLEALLTTLAKESEEALPGLRCAISLLVEKGRRLRVGAAPNLPEPFVRALDGLAIGPDVGSCGAAAAQGRRIVVEDTAEHPNWRALRGLAESAEVRASWSQPIFSSQGEVLGTLALCVAEARAPELRESEFLASAAHIAGIAIECRRTEERLRRSEALFRQLAESIREVFWLTDWRENRVLYVSPAYETIWQRSCESLYRDARSWADPIHPEDRERVFRAFRERAEAGEFDEEYRIVRDDGSVRWIHDRAFPIRDEHGTVVRMSGLSQDVTETKRVEQELRRARDELDEQRRRQVASLTAELLLAEERERRQLAQDLHDGMNQTVSLALLKLAQAREEASAGLRGRLAEIEELVEAANRSARSLTFQLSPPVLHDLGFEPAVDWLVDEVRAGYGIDIELEEGAVEREPTPLDERVGILLFRALRELLVNVAKHARTRRARVRLERQADRLRISVEDDGVAFDPTAVEGRGLGLHTIRERLSQIGGEMRIESEKGRGTRISLLAPLAAAKEGV